MKKTSLLIVCLIFLWTCSNDSNEYSKVFKLSQTQVSIENTEPIIIDMIDASGNYVVTSNDIDIAEVKFFADKNQIYIWGKSAGKTKVVVEHLESKLQRTIDVELENDILRNQSSTKIIRIKTDKSIIVQPKYMEHDILFIENSMPDIIVTTILDRKKAKLQGLQAGKSTITLVEFDLTKHIYEIEVLDKFEIRVLNNSNLLALVGDGYREYVIDGNGEYDFTIKNESLLIAYIRPFTEMENAQYSQTAPYGAVLCLKGLKRGYTTLTITDSEKLTKEFNLSIFDFND